MMTQPMVDADVPWAYVFGYGCLTIINLHLQFSNHDHQGDLDRPQMLALDQSYDLSMTGGIDTSTYLLQILSSVEDNTPRYNNLKKITIMLVNKNEHVVS